MLNAKHHKREAEIVWSQTAEEISRQVRAFNPKYKEAEGALASKQEQLGSTPAAIQEPVEKPVAEGAQQLNLMVQNTMGLHARPAAQFVKTANQFKSDIMVAKGDQTANAKSINQVLLLNVRQGDAIVITATGPDALAALSAIEALAADNFGDAN